jgi:Fur family ferric uptake transcriptional regulator
MVQEFTDEVIEERQEKVAKRMGFTLEDHSLYLYGRCKNCRKST